MCLTCAAHRVKAYAKSLIIWKVVDLSGEELNLLFQTLEEWETHLAQYDLSDLRCGDEHIRQ